MPSGDTRSYRKTKKMPMELYLIQIIIMSSTSAVTMNTVMMTFLPMESLLLTMTTMSFRVGFSRLIHRQKSLRMKMNLAYQRQGDLRLKDVHLASGPDARRMVNRARGRGIRNHDRSPMALLQASPLIPERVRRRRSRQAGLE